MDQAQPTYAAPSGTTLAPFVQVRPLASIRRSAVFCVRLSNGTILELPCEASDAELMRVLIDPLWREGAPMSSIARVLRHHVGQAKALRHPLSRVHVAGGRHVPTRVPRSVVIAQHGAISSGQPGLRVKPICSLDTLPVNQ